MDEEDELLDIVNINDHKIGTIWRSEKYEKLNKDREFLRAAEVLILNKKGKLWVPIRALSKSIAPGGMDYAASGHVSSGESYETAALREIAEELNLKVDTKSLKLLHKFPPTGDEHLFFRTVYTYLTDEEPDYNPNDFSGFEWLSPQELLKKLEFGAPAKRSLKETIKYLVDHKQFGIKAKDLNY